MGTYIDLSHCHFSLFFCLGSIAVSFLEGGTVSFFSLLLQLCIIKAEITRRDGYSFFYGSPDRNFQHTVVDISRFTEIEVQHQQVVDAPLIGAQ